MNHQYLQDRLRELSRRHLWLGLGWKLAVCWAIAAAVAVLAIWVQSELGGAGPVLVAALAGLAATLVTASAKTCR